MATKVFKDQKVLFAATGFPQAYTWGVLAAKGDIACAFSQDSGNLEDMGVESANLPRVAGIYVWQGEVEVVEAGWSGSEPVEPDVEWRGTTHPVTLADLQQTWGVHEMIAFPRPKPSVSEDPCCACKGTGKSFYDLPCAHCDGWGDEVQAETHRPGAEYWKSVVGFLFGGGG